MLVDRYETHACRWFAEQHSPMTEEAIQQFQYIEYGFVSGTSSLLGNNMDAEVEIARKVVSELLCPHDALKRFSKDIQQLLKVSSMCIFIEFRDL